MRLPYVDATGIVNNVFQNKEPWQIVTMTSTATLVTVWLWNFIFCQDKSNYYKIINIYIYIYNYIFCVLSLVLQNSLCILIMHMS